MALRDEEMKLNWSEYLYLEGLLSREIEDHKDEDTEYELKFISDLKFKILYLTDFHKEI